MVCRLRFPCLLMQSSGRRIAPFLYQMEVSLISAGKLVDQIKSYVAMRKYSIKRDEHGIVRLQLNNKDLFQFGPLDQGWWPDAIIYGSYG